MSTDAASRYRPLSDYALIGDMHTAALVSIDGAIDWCCLPRFDSPAVFCRLLDAAQGGYFRIGPTADYTATRSYVGDTAVLATTFATSGGEIRVTDFMPLDADPDHPAVRDGERGREERRIVRLIEGLVGEIEVELVFHPTFDWARRRAQIVTGDGSVVARTAGESLRLSSPFSPAERADGVVSGTLTIAPGERFWAVLTYEDDSQPRGDELRSDELETLLAHTLSYWREWSARCTYVGPYDAQVMRSALTLKLLTFAPTGAVVAAPTTSLPEAIGGVRNWDYRYSWLRDSALFVYSLMAIGYHEEALDFFAWLARVATTSDELQIMYTVDGSPRLPETVLDHLEGYRGSRPVRIGNAASGQLQLDVYGEVLESALLCEEWTGVPELNLWPVLGRLADQAARRWREPDHGIWEIRKEPQHYLHSKLMCWVALDRAVRLAERESAPWEAEVERWRGVRDEIAATILSEGYNDDVGAFTQAFGASALDASALAIPLVGFLPADEPRVLSTVQRIKEGLMVDGLVFRYLSEDGLPPGEGVFAACSFWLVDNLALAGKLDEARQLFEQLLGYANDVGLLAEEIAPSSGALLGNYPQAFTHLALIRSAMNIAKAEA